MYPCCDLFLVLGSSLSRSRPPTFHCAPNKVARLVIVNRDPTAMDEIADLVIHAGIGDTMESALAGLR